MPVANVVVTRQDTAYAESPPGENVKEQIQRDKRRSEPLFVGTAPNRSEIVWPL